MGFSDVLANYMGDTDFRKDRKRFQLMERLRLSGNWAACNLCLTQEGNLPKNNRDLPLSPFLVSQVCC